MRGAPPHGVRTDHRGGRREGDGGQVAAGHIDSRTGEQRARERSNTGRRVERTEAPGREIAAIVGDSRLRPLPGAVHPPWRGDSGAVLAAMADFVRLGAYPLKGPPAPAEAGDLSERELEVLRLVAEGLSNAEIAERLVLSTHTIHRHVANIRAKLDQPSRSAAAATAIRAGLI